MTTKLLSTSVALKTPVQKTGYCAEQVSKTLTNGFFTVDQKWIVRYWNAAAEKILRVKATDIIGRNLWDQFAGVIPLEFYALDQKVFMQDVPVHFEEYWGEMGAWFDVVTYHCDGILSVSFKSSNMPHAEYPENPTQRLKTLTELYRFVTEITNDCLWEWDLQNQEIFWIDGGHKRFFGYQVENALIPQSFWESCIHPDDKTRVLANLKKIVDGGSKALWEEEYRFKMAGGEYAYVRDRGHIIYDENNVASRIIGATQNITEKVLLEKKLATERQVTQFAITAAVLAAQEKERADIGRELNENLGQILAVSMIYIQMAKGNELKRDDYLQKSMDFILNVTEDLRKLTKTLVTPGLNFGLSESIINLVSDFVEAHAIRIEFYKDDFNDEGLDEKLEVNIFRIVQEQLNNIVQHADATLAVINLRRNGNEVRLKISDDGKGCDSSKLTDGVGILNIKSRSALYGGTATIISTPGNGFVLKVVMYDPTIKLN